MKKIYLKLIAMSLALILSVTMVVMTSYAWLVLSGNPVATGIQVAVAGGNTILTAPDVSFTAGDGAVYHYPGKFSDKLNFGQQDGYSYLKNLGNLTPVSTANGVDWFLPTYYTANDTEVQQGKVLNGSIKDVSEFLSDSTLNYANLDLEKDKDKISKGSYIYLDFWVVAPGGDYTLRISTGTGTEDGGSFAIDLPEPKDGVLSQTGGGAAAAVRVGFLANDVMLMDDTMVRYQESKNFDDRFTALRGLYSERGTGSVTIDGERFTIYEPNGDYHPSGAAENGTYLETKPLGYENGKITEMSVKDNLTMQLQSTWAQAENGAGTAISQHYATATMALASKMLSDTETADFFYGTYLQGQLSPYVNKGQFAKHTGNLYKRMTTGGVQTDSDKLEKAGATEDTYIIQLERNVPQRIRMFIWLEGQDVDCVNSANAARFALNIELAGGDS